MIPYFELTTVALGPITIQVWGFFVALGIFTATVWGMKLAGKSGLNKNVFLDFITYLVFGGIIGGRLGYIFFYSGNPLMIFTNPLEALSIWKGGMSIFGSIFGGITLVLIAFAIKKIKTIPYFNLAALVCPLGYGIGRIGCFLIHDHPGTLSSSFLAVKYPDGARLDHGLLLSIFGFVCFIVFLLLKKFKPNWINGKELALLAIFYGLTRFFLDFYRAWDLAQSDVRYFGLTPAQYFGVGLVVFGIIVLIKNYVQFQNHQKIN